jgi:hypothetical protein
MINKFLTIKKTAGQNPSARTVGKTEPDQWHRSLYSKYPRGKSDKIAANVI